LPSAAATVLIFDRDGAGAGAVFVEVPVGVRSSAS